MIYFSGEFPWSADQLFLGWPYPRQVPDGIDCAHHVLVGDGFSWARQTHPGDWSAGVCCRRKASNSASR